MHTKTWTQLSIARFHLDFLSIYNERPFGFANIRRFSQFRTPDYYLRKKIKDSTNITDLRSFISVKNTPEDGTLPISDISLVHQFSVLKFLYSSGHIKTDISHILKGADQELNDTIYVYSLIWQTIKSLENSRNDGIFFRIDAIKLSGYLFNSKSKHIVGIIWVLVKISTIFGKNVFSHLCDLNSLDAKCSTVDNLLMKSTHGNINSEDILLFSSQIYQKALSFLRNALESIRDGSVKINDLDIQQIIMLSCEPIFNLQKFGYDVRQTVSPISNELTNNLEMGNTLRAIFEKNISLLDDSQLINTFVSCYKKIYNKLLLEILVHSTEERIENGISHVKFNDFVEILSAANSGILSRHIVGVLVKKLDCITLTLHSNSKRLDKRNNDTISLHQLGVICKVLTGFKWNKNVIHDILNHTNTIIKHDLFIEESNPELLDPLHNNLRVLSLANILHFLSKNDVKYSEMPPYLIRLINAIPWDKSETSDTLVDICWSLLITKSDFKTVYTLLKKIIPQLNTKSLISSVKLLGGFYSYVDDPSKLRSYNMRYILMHCEEIDANQDNELTDPNYVQMLLSDSMCKIPIEEIVRHTLKYVKSSCMARIEEFDDIQCISNFMFYITSTIDNFTHDEYNILCNRWIKITDSNPKIKVEALVQTSWSVQKNRIYHENILKTIRTQLIKLIHTLTPGQLALCLYTLAYFNLLRGEIVKCASNVLKRMADGENNLDDNIKYICTIWALLISDTSTFDSQTKSDILYSLSKINWESFSQQSKIADLRKVLQIHMTLEFELLSSNSPIPKNIIYIATQGSKTVSNYGLMSVTQDKVRRVLDKYNIMYKGEFEIYKGIIVDFALSKNQDKFVPNLIIELDGPHHYNIICGECDQCEFKQFGGLKLIPNGKTLYRNRIMSLMGHNVVTIPWYEAHKSSLHGMVLKILSDFNYL